MRFLNIYIDCSANQPQQEGKMKSIARAKAREIQDSLIKTEFKTWFSKYYNGNYVGDIYEELTYLGITFGVTSKKENGGFVGVVNFNENCIQINMQLASRILNGNTRWLPLYVMRIILQTGWEILPQTFEEDLNFGNYLLTLAYNIAKENYPKCTKEIWCEFANIAKLMVTGDNENVFGGPRIRELLTETGNYEKGLGVKAVFEKLLNQNGPVFGPLNSIHKEIWDDTKEEYCFDTDLWDESVLNGFETSPTRIDFTVGQQSQGYLIVWGGIENCPFEMDEYDSSLYSKFQRITINIPETKILGAVIEMLQNDGWKKTQISNQMDTEFCVTFENENEGEMVFDEFAWLIHYIRQAMTEVSVMEPKIIK